MTPSADRLALVRSELSTTEDTKDTEIKRVSQGLLRVLGVSVVESLVVVFGVTSFP